MNAALMSPSRIGAVACRSAVLDLYRYRDLGGSEWIGEYGDPSNEVEFRGAEISPLENVLPDVVYPPVLLFTSPDDPRVNPAHSRKMVARLQHMKANAFYWETSGSGHEIYDSTASGANEVAFYTAFFRKYLNG